MAAALKWIAGNTRIVQFIAASAAVGTAALLACEGWWPFNDSPRPVSSYKSPSVWQFLLSDRVTLGFFRLLLVFLAAYVVASVPALIIGGRWLRGFGTSGLTADDAQVAKTTIAEYQSESQTLRDEVKAATDQADKLREERDQARELALRLVAEREKQAPTRLRGRLQSRQKAGEQEKAGEHQEEAPEDE